MDLKKINAALIERAVATPIAPRRSSHITQDTIIRALMPGIRAMEAKGVSRNAIHKALTDQGVRMAASSFYAVVGRISKERPDETSLDAIAAKVQAEEARRAEDEARAGAKPDAKKVAPKKAILPANISKHTGLPKMTKAEALAKCLDARRVRGRAQKIERLKREIAELEAQS